MDARSLLGFVIFSSYVVTSLASSCSVYQYSYRHCNYTIVCTSHPGSISTRLCDSDTYVIFIIKNSQKEQLNPQFFSTTNFDTYVREVKAVGNSWNSIDASAFRYYYLTLLLDLSGNNITRLDNDAFKSLNRLVYLNISNNDIETLQPNVFSNIDHRLKYLEELDLSNNKLAQLASELRGLENLIKLSLQNNMLKNITDDAFIFLKKLSYLNLKNNQLTLLNLTLTNLKMLRTLDVSNNFLLKMSGYEVNRLVNLRYFNASHNAMTSVESNCFNQASSLQEVDLSYNYIKINIESTMFANNNLLEYLDLYNNRIIGLQENSFQHTNLKYLNLTNNNLTGALRENTLNGLRKISDLDLSKQSVTEIKNKAFVDMKNLVNLNLSMNYIEMIENSSFANTTIIILDLSFNKLSNLYFLQNCLANLTELYINNNMLTVVPRNTFRNQTQLRSLDISMNRITTIEEYALPLNNLQYFKVFGNRLSGDIGKNIVSPSRYLRSLDLSNFNLTTILDFAFVNLTVLARLNISNSQIETIQSNNFKGVDNLYSLDISHNKITDLTFENSNLVNLKALYLNDNNIADISRLFVNKSKLLYLNLSHNNISNLTGVGGNLLPNLTVLYLSNNGIENFNNPDTNSLTTLIDLRLSSNNIEHINLSFFKELMSVDLSNNNLSSINSTTFQTNVFLQSLDISRNNIQDLLPGTFQFMKNLKLLNVSSNFLTTLRFGSLMGLHKTEYLDLSRNNIAVLDVDVFHECNELKTLIIDYNHIKTFDVERLILKSLRKLTSLSLGGNPISCKEIVRNVKLTNVTVFATRQVEITSMDKVYHEDNVHGIKCGDEEITSSSTIPTTLKLDLIDTKNDSASLSSVSLALIWCTILTILLIISGTIAYIKLYKKRVLVVSNSMTMKMRNSLVLEGSEFQSDLLD